MLSLIIFIIVLSILVIVHEAGHLLAAKSAGVRVDEFGVGFPPRLFSVQFGETKYSINLLLFGGFVKIFGENPEDSAPGDPRNFQNKNRAIQAMILVAGVFFNFLLAWVLFSGSLMLGMPVSTSADVPVGEVVGARLILIDVINDGPAGQAGLMTGDEIKSLSASGETLEAPTVVQAMAFIESVGTKELTVEYIRHQETFSTQMSPIDGLLADRPAIGVSLDEVGIWQTGFWASIPAGLFMTVTMLENIVLSFGGMIRDAFSGINVVKDLVGPVGLVGLVGGAQQIGWSYLISFTAFISLNLTVLNLLPIPILDGGRLLVTVLEAIKRGPIKKEIIGYINLAGLALLGFLMLAVTYQDIVRLF